MDVCKYEIPWYGRCRKRAETDFCSEHKKEKCACGKQASHACGHMGQFMCGAPLCDKHKACRQH